MSEAMIEVRHLKKYFNTPKGTLHAVDDVSFRIEKGRTMGVVGESGCGKSTLGRTIIHLLDSTDGQILMNGEDITHVSRADMRRINEKLQIVFQDPYSSLNPRQTVEDVIREPLMLSHRYSRAQVMEKTERLMKLVGIDERLRHAYPHELDGGFFTFQEMLMPHGPAANDGRFTATPESMRKHLARNIFFEMSHAQPWGKVLLETAVKILGADHIVYGSSSPVKAVWRNEGPAFVRSLDISQEEKEQILCGNAKMLYQL